MSVLGHSATSCRAPRNGSQISKKKELEKARQKLNSFTLMLGLRVARGTRRLRDEEVAFQAHQKDMAAMSNRPLICLPSDANVVGKGCFVAMRLLGSHHSKIEANGPAPTCHGVERLRAKTIVAGALAPSWNARSPRMPA